MLVTLARETVYNTVTIKKVTATVETVANETGLDFKLLQKSIDSLVRIVLENKIALD